MVEEYCDWMVLTNQPTLGEQAMSRAKRDISTQPYRTYVCSGARLRLSPTPPPIWGNRREEAETKKYSTSCNKIKIVSPDRIPASSIILFRFSLLSIFPPHYSLRAALLHFSASLSATGRVPSSTCMRAIAWPRYPRTATAPAVLSTTTDLPFCPYNCPP